MFPTLLLTNMLIYSHVWNNLIGQQGGHFSTLLILFISVLKYLYMAFSVKKKFTTPVLIYSDSSKVDTNNISSSNCS